MLYNKEKGKIQTDKDCLSCEYFDRRLKRCNGINKNCFEFDEKTNVAIDGVTGLPLKLNNIKEK